MAHERVALVLGPAAGAAGGIAAVIAALADEWAVPGWRVRTVATYADGGRWLKLWVALRALVTVAAALATRRAGLLHIHFATGASFHRKAVFVLLGRLFAVPVVGHAHSGHFPAFYQRQGRVGRVWVRFVLNRMSTLVVLSEGWADYYRPLLRGREPVVVPNPAAVPAIVPARPANPPEPVILCLGRLCAAKGTYDLLDAMPAILARIPGARLHLGGDGETAAVAARLAREPWGDRVRLLGWVSGADKDRELARASLFVQPSHAEGLPMALLEAMGWGLPVVATPVGAVPQVVEDATTGRLVPVGDPAALAVAVADLLGDPAGAADLGAAARLSVTGRFERGRIQRRLGDVYGRAAARRSFPRPGESRVSQ